MVCGESNEINSEKIVLRLTAEKKKCLLSIRSEKILRLSWESEKKFDHEEKTIALHASNGLPLSLC